MPDLTKYRTGREPAIGDRVQLIDVDELWTQRDEPAEPGEYVVADQSCGMLLLESGTAHVWCWPCRCETNEAEAAHAE